MSQKDYEKEAVERMAQAHQDCPAAPKTSLAWHELPEGHNVSSQPTCKHFLRIRMENALAACPLRRLLGPEAVKQLLEGKACVVMSEKKQVESPWLQEQLRKAELDREAFGACAVCGDEPSKDGA